MGLFFLLFCGKLKAMKAVLAEERPHCKKVWNLKEVIFCETLYFPS